MDGLLISSVENFPPVDKCKEQNGKYFWCIPLTVAKNICELKFEGNNILKRRMKVRVELQKI